MTKRKGIQLSDYPVTERMRRRFWAKVNKTESCWEWEASFGFADYGKFRVGPTYVSAHRVAYYIEYGKFNEELLVCHKCDNPKCVRPDHLFLGTDADNGRDKMKKGRHRYLAPKIALNRDQVIEARRLRKEAGRTYTEIGRMFGVSKFCVYEAVNGKGVYCD